MVFCSISNCGNSSTTCNFSNKGITFHKFPKDPDIKDKRISATGKKNWFPTNNSRICSVHFKNEQFNSSTKRRTLFQSAVPTIDIWRLTTVENEQNNSSATPSTSNICQNDTLNLSERTTIASPVSSNESTQGKQKLKVMIHDKEYVITKQRKQIKKIQTQNRRLKKKIKKLEDALSEIQEKYLKQTEEVSTLKNTLQILSCMKNEVLN